MTVTVTDNYLNMRTGTPLLTAPNTLFLSPGDTLEIEDFLYQGDLYNGISTWVKDKAGNFYWSGGVAGAEELPLSDEVFIPAANTVNNGTYADAEAAINQHREELTGKFSNIVNIYPAFNVGGSGKTPCADICIADENTTGLPAYLPYTTAGGVNLKVPVRVIKNFKNASPQLGRGGFIANVNSEDCLGTIGCTLSSGSDTNQYLLTCNHVMTGGILANPGNVGENAVTIDDNGAFVNIGTWVAGTMDGTMDAAIVRLDAAEQAEPNSVNKSVYPVTSADCAGTAVKLNGAISNLQLGYIVHINQPIAVDYDDGSILSIAGLITISIDTNPANFAPITQKGDSGALVYHAQTLQPVAMVIGANKQFTYAVPINNVLKAFPTLKLSINN